MKIATCIAAIGLASLTACGSSDKAGEKDKGAPAASAPTGALVKLQPGQWEMTMQAISVDAPGLPPGIADTLKARTSTNLTCITPEEANGPKGDVFGGGKDADCKQEGFSWAGGRVQGKTTCVGKDGAGKTVVQIDGQYGGQSMDVKMNMAMEMQGKTITIASRMTGRRVGDCPAGKES